MLGSDKFIGNKRKNCSPQGDDIKHITPSEKDECFGPFLAGLSCLENIQNEDLSEEDSDSKCEPMDIFDLDNMPKGVTVENNYLKFKGVKSDEDHKFVFSNIDLGKNRTKKWRLIFKKLPNWVAFGVCDKKVVFKNDKTFYSPRPYFNNGVYMVSSNGYLWNCNEPNQNSTKTKELKLNKDSVIDLEYNPKTVTLTINSNIKLVNVKPLSDSQLTVAIVLLNTDAELTLEEV